MRYRNKIFILIATTSVIRILMAAFIGLGNDEVYYRMYAEQLQWNYFDHPPMVGWLIRLFTFNLQIDNQLTIRLTAIICSAFTTYLIYRCGKKIKDEQTGFIAALLYTATIYGSIIAGTFILPDAPQMVFWAWSVYHLLYYASATEQRIKNIALLLFGMTTGFGMMCKIHTIFLWIGLIMYMFLKDKRLIRNPYFYISGIITIALFYPVIQWNIDHHFVTYTYHSNRVNHVNGGFNYNSLIQFSLGQIFYTSIILFPLFVIATKGAFTNKWKLNSGHNSLLLSVSLPLIVAALILSCFNTVLPHWTGPAYLAIILLTAAYIKERNNSILKGAIRWSLYFILILSLAGILLINYYAGTIGKKEATKWGEGDFSLDMYGWEDAAASFSKIVENDIQNGIMKPDAAIISNKWFPGAHIDHYIAKPLGRKMLVLGEMNDIHQYYWLNQSSVNLKAGDDAYCIVPSNYYFDANKNFAGNFATNGSVDTFSVYRSGKLARKFYIYRFRNFQY
jgi:4-amino-4-deoxy-L-arabinose transferase-like glycosyltransferase